MALFWGSSRAVYTAQFVPEFGSIYSFFIEFQELIPINVLIINFITINLSKRQVIAVRVVHFHKNLALNSNNIAFLPKDNNPSNCPQARPIERFWAICKKAYSKTSITSKTTKQFTIIWRKVVFLSQKRVHRLWWQVYEEFLKISEPMGCINQLDTRNDSILYYLHVHQIWLKYLYSL